MSLLRFLAAVLAATVATFFFGFLYWGVNQAPYRSFSKTVDEPEARSALKKHFPENGTYFVPGLGHEQETVEKLHEEGPVAFVHMISADGRTMMWTSQRGPLAEGEERPSSQLWVARVAEGAFEDLDTLFGEPAETAP